MKQFSNLKQINLVKKQDNLLSKLLILRSRVRWDEEKNKLLKEERGVSFEEILDSTFLGAKSIVHEKIKWFYYMNTRNMFSLFLVLLKINIYF